MRKLLYLVFFMLTFAVINNAKAEGIKELANGTTNYPETNFGKNGWAASGAAEYLRVNIFIKDPTTESVYFGFYSSGQAYNVYDPNGVLVYSNNTNANATNVGRAIAGPSQIVGASGYTAQVYTPTAGSPAGNYYIEFDNYSNQIYWDISVAESGKTYTELGRVWSTIWWMDMGGWAAGDSFEATVYAYSTEGFVSKVNYNGSNFRPYVFSIYYNADGPGVSGVLENDRKSVNNSNSGTPSFPVFLNPPPEEIMPSASFGSIVATPYITRTAAGGPNKYSFNLSSTQSGTFRILLNVFNPATPNVYDVSTEDRVIVMDIVPEPGETAPYVRSMYWDGVDGLGTTLSDGYLLYYTVSYADGRSNFPTYDAEYLYNGISVEQVRPSNSYVVELYWDDSNIPDATGDASPKVDLDGALTPAHTWSNQNYGNLNTINTWWYCNVEQNIQQTQNLPLLDLVAPPVQATNVLFPAIGFTNLEMSWTNGNGTQRVVFMKQTSSTVDQPFPVDGTTYAANTTFGSGDQIGATGWYCVYNGAASPEVVVSGLTESTEYRVMTLEYNIGASGELYNTSLATGNPANESTITLTQATDVTFTSVLSNSFTVDWTNGTGTRRAAFIKLGTVGSAVPIDNTTYTASSVYGVGDQVGTTGWYCIYDGIGTSVDVSNLAPDTDYTVMVCEYIGVTGNENYLTITNATDPNSQKTSLLSPAHHIVFSNVTTNSFDFDWTDGDGVARQIFVKQTNSTTDYPVPADGTTYTANTAFGSGQQIGTTGWYCVYDGVGGPVGITGLTPSTEYRVMVCDYVNTPDHNYIYGTVPTNPLSQATLGAAPTIQAHDITFPSTAANQMSINWINGNGTQRVVFAKQTAAIEQPFAVDNTNYTANTGFGLGTQIGATGWYCIYNGTGTSVTMNNLLEATTYRIMVCEYNMGGSGPLYNTSLAVDNPMNNTTLTAGITVSLISQNTTEGGQTATFTIVLNTQPTDDVVIGLSSDDTGEGTIALTDVTFTSADWDSPQTITVTGADDVLFDGDISYNIITGVASSTDGSYNGINPSDVAVINEDNENPTADLSVTTHGNEAGPIDIVYTVDLGITNNTGSAITFDFDDLLTGTASDGVDYTSIAGAAQISVANGSSTGTITVPVTNDALLEVLETVIAGISNPSIAAVTIGTANGTANITDNESASADLSVTTHGNEAGPIDIVYTVDLGITNNTGSAITFDFDDLLTGTASDGVDYTSIAGAAQISVANGSSTGTITVPVTNDALLEVLETVIAGISNPSIAAVTIGTANGTANITDNESASADLSVTTHGNEAGPIDIVYTVDLGITNNTGSAITFDFDDLLTGTASDGVDYTSIAGAAQISVANGSSTGTITVPVTNDALLETLETIIAGISNSSNPAVTIGTASATANIADNESASADLSVTTHGNEAGPIDIVYTVDLGITNNTGSAITFDFDDLLTGTASDGVDYTSIAGAAQISVANGSLTGTITVPVTNDALLEVLETVIAGISNPSIAAVTVGTANATANITDNESASADLNVTTHGNEAGPIDIVYTVDLGITNNTGSAITFDFDDLLTGTASDGVDYTSIAGAAQISVANGSSTGTISVPVTNDALLEVLETVIAGISNPSIAAVTIGTASATANITDNESASADLSVTTHGNEAGPIDIVYTVDLGITNNTGSAITFDFDDLLTGTASDGVDYTSIAGAAQISVANSSSTGTITVPVTNDALLEVLETVIAGISNPSIAAVTVGTANATANITDNESASADLSVTTHGNEAGPIDIVYTVDLGITNNTGSAITFDFDDLTTGTATSGSDYTAIAGASQISVANGSSTGTIIVLVTDDGTFEAVETVIAGISNSSIPSVTIGTASATANIADDDDNTDIYITKVANDNTPDEGGNVTFTVTVTNNGPVQASSLVITDVLPAGLTLVSATPTVGSWADPNWTVGTLNNGITETISIVASVDAGTSGDVIVNNISNTQDQNDDNTTPDDDDETVTVNNDSDIVLTKVASDNTPDEGDNVTFTVTVTNNGAAQATNLVVMDALPAGLTLVSATPTVGSWTNPNWTVGTLNNGITETISIVASVDAGTSGNVIVNNVSNTQDQDDDNTTPDDDDETVTVNNDADIVLTKVASDNTPDEGDNVTFTVTVTNNGAAQATNLVVSDALPAGLTLVSATPTVGSWTDPNWTVGTLNDGATETISIVASVDAGTSGDVIVNNVSNTQDQNDDNTTPDDDDETVTVNNDSDIVLTKVASDNTPDEGDNLTFTVTVTNNGAAQATNLVIMDALPAGLTLVSATPTVGSWTDPNWTVGTLNDGATETISIVTSVDAGTSGDVIVNNVSNTQDQNDDNTTPDDDDETVTVNNDSDIVLTKVASDNTPDEGDNVTFTVTVTNNGAAQATNLVIMDALPAGLTLVSATPTVGSWTDPNWTVGTLNDGATETISIVASVDVGTSGDVIVNNISNTQDQNDDNTTPDDDDETITVNNDADIVLTKVVSDNTPDEGDNVTFTVTVTNNGTAQATNLVVMDALPSGLTLVSATPTVGSWTDPNWTLGTLNDGSTETISIVASVDVGTSGDVIVNNISNTQDQNDDNTTPDDDDETITVNNDADIVLTKVASDNTPDEGDNVTFTVTVTNNGAAQATNLVVSDALPAGLTLVSATPTVGSWTDPNWTLGTLNDGSTETISIVASVDAGTSGDVIVNNVSNTQDQNDDNTTPDDDDETVTVNNDSDIVLTKVASDNTPDEGDNVTFTVTVTNNGSAQATNLVVMDALPAGLTLVSATPTVGSWTDPNWTVGALNDGATETISIVASVDAGTSGDVIVNNISNTQDQNDDNTTPDDDDETVTINNDSDIVLTKVADDNTPDEGDNVTFTVTVTNNGTAQATNLVVTDALPAGLTLVSATPTVGTWTDPDWTIGTLAIGSTETIDIIANVDAGTSDDMITNTVTNTQDQTDDNTTPDDDDEVITVNNESDIVITKVADTNTPDEGDDVTFTITVTNNGAAQATNLVVTDALPAGLTLVSATPTLGTWTDSDWTVGTLDNGMTETLVVVANVDAGTSEDVITNTISNTQDQDDNNDTPDDGEEIITINNESDIVITKVADTNTPDEGDEVTFTITVTNNGPAQATNLIVTDALPAGLTLVSATPTLGTWTDPDWTVGTLDNGMTETLVIIANVDAGTSEDVITNTITNTQDQDDNNDTPDDGEEIITINNESDIVITKVADTNTPDEGDDVTFTITVTNNGTAQATNLIVTDALPAGLTLVSATPTLGTWTDPDWIVGTLDNGMTETIVIVANVDAGTSEDVITNTISNTQDQDDNNDTPDDGEEIITINNESDIVITKVADTNTPDEGDDVTFTITVTNNGPAQATNLIVTDALPVGLTLVSATPTVGTWTDPDWTVGTLDNGMTETIVIVANVDAGTSEDIITNTISNAQDQDDNNDTPDDGEEIITINNDSDIVITKVADTNTPDEGDDVTFTITVTNNGPAQATNLVVIDALPAGLTLVSATPTLGTWTDPDWTVGTLDNGITETLVIVANVDAGTSEDVITNTISNTQDQDDNNDTLDDGEEIITINNDSDIVITKVADNNIPNEGDDVTFTITVTNNGPAQATNLVVTDVLPAGLTLVSATPTVGLWTAPEWTVGTLDNGVTETLVIVANVDSGTLGNTIVNTISNTQDQDDNNDTPDDDEEEILVTNNADIVLTKVADNNAPEEGDDVTFTITVTNNGPSQVTNLIVTDALPSGLTLVSATPTVGTWTDPDWTVGTLDVSSTETIVIVASVDAGTSGDEITNTITNTQDQNDDNTTPDDDTEIITVGNTSDIVLAKTVDVENPEEGETVTYTITVTNNGAAQATNLVVTDDLPDGLTLVSATPTLGTWSDPEWTIGTLANGATETIVIVATVNEGTSGKTIINAVTNAQDQDDSNDTPDISTVTIVIGNETDIVLVKTVDNENPNVGDDVTYTITVTNNGPAQATNLVVTDVLPSGITLVSATPTTGTWMHPDWTIGTLDSGVTESMEIVVNVDEGTSGQTITNIVTNTQDQEDNDSTPDINTVSFTVNVLELSIPEGFSPNGDNSNDFFEIVGIENYDDNTLTIFNRWGNKVFEASPYANDWAGKNMFGISLGNDLPVGTYFYILEYDNGTVVKGYVYLTK